MTELDTTLSPDEPTDRRTDADEPPAEPPTAEPPTPTGPSRATPAPDIDAEAVPAEPEAALDPEPATEPEAAPAVEVGPDADPEPVVEAGPRTVGRFIADALRAAGVRYAFTVPGESFLGLLDAFEGAGIRVIATRHEGAAAFMAEAHGQLTGRPAVCLGTRAVGGSNLAIGIHTARQDSTPMFVAVGPGRAGVPGSRGVPGDRPGRLARPARQVGGRAAAPRPRSPRS